MQAELQKFNDVLYWSYSSATQSVILFQQILYYVKSWIYGCRGEQFSNIIGTKAFSFEGE